MANDLQESLRSTMDGMALAEYNMLLEKAKRNEMLIMSDEQGNPYEVPAREHFKKLYGEDAPTF